MSFLTIDVEEWFDASYKSAFKFNPIKTSNMKMKLVVY